ncbi:hypothetical protein T439DRAFT_321457 [Meredithblackwellia eburnea MCA 4105]
MYSVVAVLALAAAVKAQSFAIGGPGRFPCSTMVNGVPTPDASQCTAANMAANQACPPDAADLGNVDGGFKNYGAVPTSAVCTQDAASGNYYCGYFGATCSSDANCDNGHCVGGLCTGSLGYPCSLDSTCLGNLYCLDPSGTSTGACGNSGTNGNGALCDDGCAAGNDLCVSGLCDGNTGTCVAAGTVGASQRARSRRSELTTRGSRCPASHTACSVAGSVRGFECVDTQSNLEQCGACASAGGVDCTALPGIDAVGCVAGQCEIWACAEGFAWDAATASCAPALIA